MRRSLPLALTAVLALTACGSGGDARTTTSAAAPARTTSGAATSTAAGTPTPHASTTGTPTPAPTSAPAPGTCAALAASLTPEQRVGQLLMVTLDGAWPMTYDDRAVQVRHVGSVFYLGGWRDGDRVRRTSEHLQSLATAQATGGIGMLVAADQEGGQVQQLRGPGFTRLPSALEQGTWPADQVRSTAERTGRELRSVGVNLNLAPVADTVDPGVGAGNDPIGRWGRHYATDPAKVTTAVRAAVAGLQAGGVGAVVKHFPGLGRIRANTDFSATGITDRRTRPDDATLAPFAEGARAGAAVMVSSAVYPQIDPDHNAVFSSKVVTDLLRGRLGHHGLVMSDDLGAARAVAHVPAGERAVKAVDAGVDLVLTGRLGDARTMTAALQERASTDPAFARKVQDSATRVVAYKARLGLARCR